MPSSSMDSRTCSSSSINLFILGDLDCHHPFWDSKVLLTAVGRKYSKKVICDILPLNDPDTSTFLHCSSPDIYFAPSSIAISCSWSVSGLELWSRTNFANCPSFSTLPSQRTNPFLPFPESWLDHFAFYFDSHFPSVEEYFSLFPLVLLSSLLWYWMRPNFLFLSAASNANLKPVDIMKGKKRYVKNVKLLLPLIKLLKIVRLTSLLPNMPRLSLPKPRLRHGRQHAHLSLL